MRCCGEEQAYARANLALALELARAPGSNSLVAAACTRRLRLGLLAGRSAPWWFRGAGDSVGGRWLGGNTKTTSASSPRGGADTSTFLCFCGLSARGGPAGHDSRPMRRATTPGAATSAADDKRGAGGGGGVGGGDGSLRGEERSEEGRRRRGEKRRRLRARRRCQSRRWNSTPPAQRLFIWRSVFSLPS
ncbi:hypothetical protein E2562_034099 [Oryza meyeriana var. granulata]|uniref:Uncharacterized protein n=1 Tax=Oryza meyeriana var. granulata TaxID=110450 RepID=A0A6G1E653_9ORYZ|nr:hypothetical protein E2562_034099 [Oryza meyeriana var. granulata]